MDNIESKVIKIRDKKGLVIGTKPVYKINDINKNRGVIDKLLERDYIIAYDGHILGEGNFYIMVPAWLSVKEIYKSIKNIYPNGLAVYNLLEIGCVEFCFK